MPGLNKRSVVNMNILRYNRDNPFINFVRAGAFLYNYQVDIAQIDANGYAIDNSQILLGSFPESAVLLPSSANYAGAYVLKWTGTGTVFLPDAYAWTYNAAASSGATELTPNAGQFSGTNPRIVVTPVGLVESADGFSIKIHASDPSNTNDYVRDLKFYMITDEADLNAGKVFRSGWKQTILDLNPGVIRALNWTGGSATLTANWSSQLSPDNVSYFNGYAGLVPYGLGTVTSLTNAIAVAAATGMPVAMTHGEIVACGLSGSATVNSSRRIITDITNAASGVVTSAGHSFVNGQRVVFQIAAGQTNVFYQLHFKTAIVSAVTTNTFTINVDTTTFGTFSTLTGNSEPGIAVTEYIGLNVGLRGEYPVMNLNGWAIDMPAAVQYVDQGYTHFIFDKYLVGNRDVGVGAWVAFNASASPASYVAHQPGVPLEVCVALVNELTTMKGGGGAINLWITTPPRAMMTGDPDYTAAENWAVKAVDRCLNGAGSWAGLNAASALLIEYSNETWNTAFTGCNWAMRAGQLRYGGSTPPFTTSASDINSFPVLRSIVMCQDLGAAYPTEIASGRLIRVAGGQGTFGINAGGNSVNEQRVQNAKAQVLADAWNIGGAQPYTKFETFCWASYFDAAASDYAWYANLPTYSANWAAAVGTAAKEAVCADWITNGILPDGEGPPAYVIKGGQFSTVLGGLGRTAIQYEGGYDWQTIIGGVVDTTTKRDFLTAIQNGTTWAATQKSFFTSIGALTYHYHPAIFIQTTSDRWGYNRPNFNNYVGSVEGAALNPTWASMGEYNDANDTGLAVSTTVVVSSGSPSSFGASVTFTATVTGGSGTPTGSVVFKDGVTTLGSGVLNGSGVATYSTSALAAGTHTINALYGGDVTYLSSSDSTSQVVTGSTVIILGQACL